MLYVVQKIWKLVLILALCIGAEEADFLFSNAVNEIFDPGYEMEFYGTEVNSELMQNYTSGNYRSAIVELRRLLNLALPDGRLDFYHFLLGECYFALELPDLAIDHYKQNLYFAPNTVFEEKSHFRLVQLYAALDRENDMDASWKVLSTAYSTGSLNAGAAYIVAKTLASKNRFEEALAAVNTVANPGAFRPSYLYIKGFLLSKVGRSSEGMDTLLALITSTKNRNLQDETRLTLARIYHEQGFHDKALATYDEIKSQSPHYPIAQLKKAFVYLSQGKPRQALELAKESSSDANLTYEAALIRIDSYYALKDTLSARRTWEELATRAKFTRLRGMLEEEKIFVQDLIWRQQRLSDRNALSGNRNKKDVQYLSGIEKSANQLHGKLEQLQKTLSKYPEFNGEWKLEGTLEKKYLEYVETEWQDIEAQFKVINEKDEDGPQEGLDSLLEKRRDLMRLRTDLYQLMAKLQQKHDGISQAQAKYIDVGLLMYGRLKKSLYSANQEIRELNQTLQRLEKEGAQNK